MCLSTIYRNSKEDNNILFKNVCSCHISGDEIILTNIMGEEKKIQGKIIDADFVGGSVIIKEVA